MDFIFNIVALMLELIAQLTGFTYKEINIIAYYLLLPLVYMALIDRIIGKHVLKVLYVAGWVAVLCLVGNFSVFSNKVFDASVGFLLWFSHVGLNYTGASVVICVVLPLIVFVVLLLFAFPSLRKKVSEQPKDRPQPWFPARTVGYGWGMPTCWQGRVVVGLYFVLLIAGALTLLREPRNAGYFFAYMLGLSLILILICRLKGERLS